MKYELNSVTSKFTLFNFIHDKFNKKNFPFNPANRFSPKKYRNG